MKLSEKLIRTIGIVSLVGLGATAVILYGGLPKIHAGATAAVAKISYTCPMHAEIIRGKPGACPECGMALVPAGQAAKAGCCAEHKDSEMKDCPHEKKPVANEATAAQAKASGCPAFAK